MPRTYSDQVCVRVQLLLHGGGLKRDYPFACLLGLAAVAGRKAARA
jgi:hypothetical protein